MDTNKIIKVDITPMPRPMPAGMFDPMPAVAVTYEDGTTERLFEFFPDELTFHADDFMWLTREQALELRHKRDVAYLQSSTINA